MARLATRLPRACNPLPGNLSPGITCSWMSVVRSMWFSNTKWPEVTTTGSVASQVTINFLDSLFSRWGLPKTIATDDGPQLVSAEFASYLESKGIRHVRTAYYHPRANGGAEHFHQSLKNGLRAQLVQQCPYSVPTKEYALECKTIPYILHSTLHYKFLLGILRDFYLAIKIISYSDSDSDSDSTVRIYRLQVTGYSFGRRFYPKRLTSSANNRDIGTILLDS